MADIEKLVGSESRLEVGQKINEIIENKANKNLNNTGMVTNCLLEVPQRIKLELNDGVLTLKAGSEVIVPNGFEADGVTPKFDYVTVESDISGGAGSGAVHMFCLSTTEGFFGGSTLNNCHSGSSAPSSIIHGTYWYDTTNNVVRRYMDGSWTSGHSLPMWVCSNTSINHIFNGFGYIGRTFWADKDIKCLAPNGRNADGTLNNVEIVTKKLSTFTQTNNASYIPFVITSAGRVESAFNNVHDDIANINSHGVVCHVGRYTTTAEGGITYFTTNQPFRAAEYSSIVTLAERTNYYVKERYANGYSWYRLWNDGYLEQGGITGSAPGRVPARTVTFIKPFTSGLVSIVTNGAFGGSSNNPYMSFFQITGATVNNFTAYARCDENIQMYWVARGYA